MPRVAIGTVEPTDSVECIALALVRWAAREQAVESPIAVADGTTAVGPSGTVHHFFSSATHHRHDTGLSATGHCSRHFDSWTMDRDACRRLLARCNSPNGLVVVEGHFEREDVAEAAPCGFGSRLNQLCWWLDLPRLAVIDVRRIDACQIPRLPEVCDGVLLDQVANAHAFRLWQTILEPLWGVPVVGGLEMFPRLRGELAALPEGCRVSPTAMDTLAESFGQLVDRALLARLASRRPAPLPADTAGPIWCIDKPVVVAVAYDEAFYGYLPTALEQLEALGATIVDFSPLRDEELPAGADIVWLGDGRPHHFAATLAQNHCLLSALHNHIAAGRRVYAERGGMAYLCQQLHGTDGQWHPMLGIVPAAALHQAAHLPDQPVEVELAACCWLGRRATRIRGYRSMAWQFEPLSDAAMHLTKAARCTPDVVCHRRVVASRLALDFAGQNPLLQAIVEPIAVKPLPVPVGTAAE